MAAGLLVGGVTSTAKTPEAFEQKAAAAKALMQRDPSDARRRAEEAAALAEADAPSRAGLQAKRRCG